jgi:hypothetical protein
LFPFLPSLRKEPTEPFQSRTEKQIYIMASSFTTTFTWVNSNFQEKEVAFKWILRYIWYVIHTTDYVSSSGNASDLHWREALFLISVCTQTIGILTQVFSNFRQSIKANAVIVL